MIYKKARCPVFGEYVLSAQRQEILRTSKTTEVCTANHGYKGCSCGFAGDGIPCMHPVHKYEWQARTGGIVPPQGTKEGSEE